MPLRVRLFGALQITTQPQPHSAFSSYNKITNLSRPPPSPLSFLASRDLVVARLNHPEYQGLRRTKEGQAFVPSMPLSPIIRASVLSIFRAVQYFPLPQLPSTTTSNAIEFSLHRSCSCQEILVALKCLRKCIRWHAIPLSPVPFIHLIFIIFEIPTLPSPSISSQLLPKKISKSLLSISNYNGRRSHSREKPQAPQVPQPLSLTTITYTFIDYGRFWLYRIQDSDPSS